MIDASKLKHVFFDLDDTLWDFEKNSENILNRLFKEHNLGALLSSDFKTFFIAYKKKNAELWQQYNNKKISKEELRKRRFHETFLQFGHNNFDLSYFISETYIKESPYGTELKKGALELLNTLKDNFELHIITNGFKEVQHIKLKQCNLEPYFENVIISEDVGYNKPDVKIFREAEKLSNAKANECLMIGDNFETDIRGAKKAGWESIWYNPYDNKRYQAQQVKCLTELIK